MINVFYTVWDRKHFIETLMTELVVIVEYTKHESEPVTPEVTE